MRLTDRVEGSADRPDRRWNCHSSSTCPACRPQPTIDKSLCELTTTLDTRSWPGAAAEGDARGLGASTQLKVFDGGPDEDADTTADNLLFAVQGVFVP